MSMSVAHSVIGAGAFIASDMRTMLSDGGYTDDGGKLITTGFGWACAVGPTHRYGHVSLLALRGAGALPPGIDPVARAEYIVSKALEAAGLETRNYDDHPEVAPLDRVYTLVLEPGVEIIGLRNGSAKELYEATALPRAMPRELQLEHSRVILSDLAAAGEDLATRICVTAQHFATVAGLVGTVSEMMEVGYLDAQLRKGFLRGYAHDIANADPGELLWRFQAHTCGLLTEERLFYARAAKALANPVEADGEPGIESQRAATRKGAFGAGTAVSGTEEERVRGGDGGYGVSAALFHAVPVMSSDGGTPLIDTNTRRVLNSTIDPTMVLDNPTGILGAGAQQTLASVARSLAKGYQSGYTKDDVAGTGVVAFSPVYQNTPAIRLAGGKAANATFPYDDFAAGLATASGFTCKAKNKSKGTVTARTADFAASTTATSPGAVTGNAALASAPSLDNNYKARFRVDVVCVSIGAGTTTIVVAIEVSADGSTGWTEYATRSFSASRTTTGTTTNTYSGNEVTVNVAGLVGGSGAAVRLKYKSKTVTGGASSGGTASTVTGYNNTGGGADAGHGVTYNTDAGVTYQTKTPDADDYIFWEAWEVVS